MKIVFMFGLLAAAFGIDSLGNFSLSSKRIRAAFEFLDKNSDGIIHLSELFTRFRKHDANDDQKVSYEEFTTGVNPEMPSTLVNSTFHFFDKMDDNVDGDLDPSVVCNLFTFMDTNNNRRAAFVEYKNVIEQVVSSILEA